MGVQVRPHSAGVQAAQVHYEARMLGQTCRAVPAASWSFCFVFLMQVVLGYSIFVIESARPDSQFQTVGSGVYWAIVTMTTVGYGDVVPQTELGRLLASVVMLLGFGIIAVPTRILTISGAKNKACNIKAISYRNCGQKEDRFHAMHCDKCGEKSCRS